MKVIKVPTGKIFIVDGKKGKLECPSYDEDDGLITCGNAILSGSIPQTTHTVIEL